MPQKRTKEHPIRESQIERYLVKTILAMDGTAIKFTSPSHAGMPDRLVLLPGGVIFAVEVKAPGKQPRPLQHHVFEMLRSLGLRVDVIDSFEQVDRLKLEFNPREI